MSVLFWTLNILGHLQMDQVKGHLLSKLNHAFSPYFLEIFISITYPYIWSHYVTSPLIAFGFITEPSFLYFFAYIFARFGTNNLNLLKFCIRARPTPDKSLFIPSLIADKIYKANQAACYSSKWIYLENVFHSIKRISIKTLQFSYKITTNKFQQFLTKQNKLYLMDYYVP